MQSSEKLSGILHKRHRQMAHKISGAKSEVFRIYEGSTPGEKVKGEV